MEAAREQIMNAPRRQRSALVLGLGVTGLSCVRWLLARGDRVLAMDSRAAPPGLDEALALQAAAAQDRMAAVLEVRAGGFDEAALQDVDLVVVSPGIPMEAPIVRAAAARGLEVLGDVELFAREATSRVVAITGTNGKSTVTTLVDLMLRAAGCWSESGGNIGTPVLELLSPRPRADAGAGRPALRDAAASGTADRDGDLPELVVLELSSFQLERTRSLAPEVAVLLNVSEDHLDHHGTFERYLAAKRRVFRGAQRAVISADQAGLFDLPVGMPCVTFSARSGEADYHLVDRDGACWLARRGKPLVSAARMRLVGSHNLANALAALAVVEAVLGRAAPPACLDALATFPGLAHRMQHVRTRHGVRWVNDSKATNPGAALAAVAGIETPVVLVAGGRGKGADFTPLTAAFAGRLRAAVLIGEDARRLATALEAVCPVHFAPDIAAAVGTADRLATRGDTVLLAPACASQDMFVDYRQRGDVFARCVEALP
jgi:UDP-N-acetylmuramoylalanine--D-glutamate ligase